MDTIIAAPTSCEVHAVIHFLHAEGQTVAKIHRRLCRVYNDMLWVTVVWENGAENSGMGALMRMTKVVKDDTQLWLMNSFKVDQCVHGKCPFMISEISEEFPQTSRTTLYWIVMDRLGYHKYCAQWVPKQLTFTKHKEWGQPWRFFSATGKRGTNFLTELWLVTRLGYSSWMQRPKSSLSSGCIRILPTSPRNSNEHCRTKKWWLHYSGTEREFWWQNSWHQGPSECQRFIVKCWISFGGQSKTNGAGCSLKASFSCTTTRSPTPQLTQML